MKTLRTSARRGFAAFAGPAGWRAVAWPAVFAGLSLALLVFDHLQERIGPLLFWLCVVLIACVFAWLVETARRKSAALAAERRRAARDAATGLRVRAGLDADLSAAVAERSPRRLIVLGLPGLQPYCDRAGAAAADRFAADFASRLAAESEPAGGSAYRIDYERFAVLVPEVAELSAEALIAHPAPLDDGAETTLERGYGEVAVPGEAADPGSALGLAGQRLSDYQRRQQRSARRQAHAVLMAAIGARRPELRVHLRSVAFRTISVCRRLGLDGAAIDDVFLAAELQDVGLLTVPESVLEKRTALTSEESTLIRHHPVAGARIVAAAPGLTSVAETISALAERYDGSGYPEGLVGDQIPIGARIIRPCVAFAAMTAKRPYREERSTEEALAELRSCTGTEFDPAVVEALAADLAEEAELLSEGPEGEPDRPPPEPSPVSG